MRRLLVLSVTMVMVSMSLALPAVATAVEVLSPADVVIIDRDLNGSVVTVRGEAVGEHLRAMGGGRWVNVLGDEVGLGIWVTDEMAEEITYFGDYDHDGDVVEFRGPVNVACETHGGEFDVHADTMRIVSVGGPREHEIVPLKGVIGIAGIVAAFLLWRLFVRRREAELG